MAGLQREMKRGTLELVLLALLEERDRYGYELVSDLEGRGGEFFQVKEGTLYPVLYRLEDNGWIESYRDIPKRGVPRKYYRLTEQGREYLATLRGEWSRFRDAVERFLEGDDHGQH
ncbi:PadR family transcriptional regulator [bacterium]|nr:PadR family transcriptional regulator [bacterium]